MNATQRLQKLCATKKGGSIPPLLIHFLIDGIRYKRDAFLCMTNASFSPIEGGISLTWKGKIKTTLDITDKAHYHEMDNGEEFSIYVDMKSSTFWAELWGRVKYNINFKGIK